MTFRRWSTTRWQRWGALVFSAIRETWRIFFTPRRTRAAMNVEALVTSLELSNHLLKSLVSICEGYDRLYSISKEKAQELVRQRGQLEEAAEALAFAMLYGDYDEERDPALAVASWRRYGKPVLEQDHSGSCIGEYHSCARCQAEDARDTAVRFAIAVRDFESSPNPGSDEAVALGCLCPRMDNGYGDPEQREFPGWVITESCPVHPFGGEE